ncbi:hypothetical protein FH972_014731 [Carpinus fangiana]|uniref:Uncharacterized protein n=1 Tax=Carpinus fangiana TaxID=176857 RepID=A0A5N6RDB5_9ROSI|nr:hypothetical protein FH972_014731 [Carpinus fangiana]
MPVSTQKDLGISLMAASEDKRKKMMEGVFVISWLIKHLGFSKVDLDQVIDGLHVGLLDGIQDLDLAMVFGTVLGSPVSPSSRSLHWLRISEGSSAVFT